MSNEHETRAERIEEAARDFYEATFEPKHDSHIVGALIGHRVLLGEALALPPDPPRGDEKLRELRSTFVRQLKDAQHGRRSKSNLGLDHSIAAIDRLLAAAPKPEPSESPASMDHDWGPPHGPVTWDHCHRCGIIKRADGKNSEVCKGAPRIGPRSESPAEPPLDDEAAIEAWEDITRLHQARVTSGVFVSPSTLASGVTIMRRLAREKADLRAKLAAAKDNDLLAKSQSRTLTCAFCGHEYPPGTPPTQHDALTAHVMECEQHPLRAKLAAAESALVARHGGEPLALLAELDEARAKLAAAHEQLRCPDCGCATPEEAEAGECGCDSPVCSVEVTTTVAKELCDVAKKLAAAEARIAEMRNAALGGGDYSTCLAKLKDIVELGKGGA